MAALSDPSARVRRQAALALTALHPAGLEDTEMPALGAGFFYLVQFHDVLGHNSYGTESASRPRVVGLEDCPD